MAAMKKYIATYACTRTQYPNVVCESTLTIEASNIRSARKKAEEFCYYRTYGCRTLLDIQLKQDA